MSEEYQYGPWSWNRYFGATEESTKKTQTNKPTESTEGQNVLLSLTETAKVEQPQPQQTDLLTEASRRPFSGVDEKPIYTLEQYKADKDHVRALQFSNANMHRFRNLYNVKF
jgi:hypothetical protein